MNLKVWFLVFSFSLFAFVASSADTLPTNEDIDGLAEAVRLAVDAFMQESFELRMGYEFSGRFINQNNKDSLYKLAERAGEQLRTIKHTQQELKRKIEDYQGNDWDDRYGSTGLWRKLFADLYATSLSRCEVDFYLALAAGQPQKNEILRRILGQINLLNTNYHSPNSQFLRARTTVLLAQTTLEYKSLAAEQLDLLISRTDIPDTVYCRAVIEKAKSTGMIEASQLKKLTEYTVRSKCDDIELVLSLAFLKRRLNWPEALKETVRLCPQTQEFLGSLILSQLSYQVESGQLTQQNLLRISAFEAELAAQAAWRNKPQDYKVLLDYLSGTERFQTPLITYVAAVAFTESLPTKAVGFLIKASELQKAEKDGGLDIEACEIAEQAAKLAYNLFAQDLANCRLVVKAFANYCTMAGYKTDEELQYLYTIVLRECGQAERSEKILQKIAAESNGNWRNRAMLELVTYAIQRKQYENRKQRDKLLRQLDDIIASCTGGDENSSNIRAEAVTIYCQLLLESEDESSAREVLIVLGENEVARDPNMSVFKSRALRQLGRLDKSAEYLLKAVYPNCCKYVGEAMELLSEVIDELEPAQRQTDGFLESAQNYKRLAEICYDCLGQRRNYQAGLYLAETTILMAGKKERELLKAGRLLDDLAKSYGYEGVDMLRCRARLLAEQNKFAEAAQLWAKICEMRKNEMPLANQRSWKWWRAKFYELDCWSRRPQTRNKDLLHTIEVLENSFEDIPLLWVEKLSLLKQMTRQSVD